MRSACLALLLLGAGGCELLRPPTEIDVEPVLQLHSLLRGGSDTVAVLVEWSGAERGVSRRTPVSGARVRISGGGVEAALAEAPHGFPPCAVDVQSWYVPGARAPIGAGCYAAVLPGGVRAGTSYSLSVDLPGGGAIAGRTTVPLPPEVVQPTENQRVPMAVSPAELSEPLTLRWRTPSTGSTVAIRVVSGAVFETGRAVPGAECVLGLVGADPPEGPGGGSPVARDSARVRASVLGCRAPADTGGVRQVRPDSLAAALRLMALDSAYAAYLVRFGGDAVRAERAAVGITGAFGVFAGATITRRGIVLVYPRP